MRPAARSARVIPFVLLLLACALPGAAQSPPGKSPVAVVAGKPIYDEDLARAAEGRLLQLRREEFDLKRAALDSLIEEMLLEAEAKKRGVSVEELLAKEVDAKLEEPTDADVAAFYQARRERLNRPLEEVREQIRRVLRDARQRELREELLAGLRKEAEVSIFLLPPRSEVSADPARVRGRREAPVVIVEFSDFQCPYCRGVQGALRQLLARYEGRVQHAFRDFPLDDIHPQAQKAAEAARCAAERGKFWEYHALLFEHFGKLGRDTLLAHARMLGLPAEEFSACLDTGKYEDAVRQDVEDGLRAGVNGTPAFFINGILINGAQPLSAFQRIIEDELAASRPK